MTSLQIYLLIAPMVLLVIGAGTAYWWTIRSDGEQRPTR
jgi:hypothetical protein